MYGKCRSRPGGAEEPEVNRRGVVLGAAAVAPTLVVGTAYAAVRDQRDRALARLTGMRDEVAGLRAAGVAQELNVSALQRRVDSLSQRWVASGGGANRKMMPDDSGRETVELLEVFSFDRNHAFCRVDTNPTAFVMPTYAMGVVPIPAGSFFMAMGSTSIDRFEARQMPDGKNTATLLGLLDCHTEVVTASVTVGSRTASEPAAYEIIAVDGGPGGGPAGDSFAFTVFFDLQTAPLNHGIFGPSFTFTGQMVDGEITIQNLARLAP